MREKRPSVLWAAMPLVFAQVHGAGWVKHPQLRTKPEVKFGSHVPVDVGELVVVTGESDQPPVSSFITGGTPGRDDTPMIRVRIWTTVPGTNEVATWSRLGELGTRLEMVFRDLDTGKPIISAPLAELGVRFLTCSLLATNLIPAGGGGVGWTGQAEYGLSITARI